MRYYVEINGESSLDIQGLMIQSLPSISKPLMRSKQETIDGRDGDIVTKLGYSAYDKTLKIGLWGNYDINEVIAFFNQEGEIVFSNEPDKYYRFTILNRDDYVSQLDKFRTCTIALHCQPYKYKLNEEAGKIENEYVEEEGTSLTFNNTLVAPMNIDLKGNTSQTGTPTPSSPQPVNVVSGDNEVAVQGKNLFNSNNLSSGTLGGITTTISNSTLSMNGTSNIADYIYSKTFITKLKAGTYTTSMFKNSGTYTANSGATAVYIRKNDNTTLVGIETGRINNSTIDSPTTVAFTLTEDTDIYFSMYCNKTNQVYNDFSFSIQIEENSTATTYEAYNGTTYPIDLPVENLFQLPNADTLNQVVYSKNSDNTINLSGTASANTIFYVFKDLSEANIKNGDTYTISVNKTLPSGVEIRLEAYNGTTWKRHLLGSVLDNTTKTITATANLTDATQIRFGVFISNGSNSTISNLGIQLEYGSKPNTFTPYGTTPIELCKIGTYQDYFYKDSGIWYLHKETGKVVLNGSESENWSVDNPQQRVVFTNIASLIKTPANDDTTFLGLCNKLLVKSLSEVYVFKMQGVACSTGGNLSLHITGITDNGSLTLQQWKTWLSNNNVLVNYVLKTPTNTEITDTTLKGQLDAILEAQSRKGATNITQVNNDLPFIITASVLSGTDSITLTNEGNTTSKPTLTITGSGVVGVYLENIQMFNISLGTNETIIIDTENMEAYYGSQLKNRQVTGDYSNFALQSGTNNLKFTGAVTNVEITNYNRWI